MTLLGWRLVFIKQSINPETLANQKFTDEHEENSGTHVRKFQEKLDALAWPPADPSQLDPLKDRLDIQLKIEDLILKSRTSEHTAWIVYGPLVIPLLTGVLGLILGYVAHLAHH
jgi:hypothetical protein